MSDELLTRDRYIVHKSNASMELCLIIISPSTKQTLESWIELLDKRVKLI